MSDSKIHHTPAPSRGMEAAEHGVKPHCLNKPSKAKGYSVAVAWGQRHVGEDGTTQTGVSRTEAASALRGGKLPTDPPVIAKRLPIPGPNPGTPSRPERGQYNPAMHEAVMGEAKTSPDDFARFGKLQSGTTEN